MKTVSSFVLHEFPIVVRKALKQLALGADQTLRQYVIDLLTKHISQK